MKVRICWLSIMAVLDNQQIQTMLPYHGFSVKVIIGKRSFGFSALPLESYFSTSPYLTFTRSSFSSMGSDRNQRNMTVARA